MNKYSKDENRSISDGYKKKETIEKKETETHIN